MGEHAFRVAFGVLWLVFYCVRVYFGRRIPPDLSYTRVFETRERWLFRAFAVGYLATIAYAVTPWLDAARIALPGSIRWLGGAVVATGIGLVGWAHAALGRNWTAVLALAEDHQMVTSGPYRRVRHPMYSAFFIVGVGFSILSADWLVALLYLGTLLPMYFLRVSAEEQMMIGRFGDAYREYMTVTGRLCPRLRPPWRS